MQYAICYNIIYQICHNYIILQQKFTFAFFIAYGISKPGALVNNSSLFRIASISKMLTAVAIMRLYEDGKLKLNDKVFGKKGKYLYLFNKS